MRIGVAEDVVLMRQGIIAALAAGGHEVIWEVGVATEIVSACAADLPDVLVTDVRMPPHEADDGLKAALAARALFPELAILVLSQFAGNDYAAKLVAGAPDAVGGTGYLLKESVGRVSQFLLAVEEVASGKVVIDPRVIAHLLVREKSPIAQLTEREREVLSLIAQGKTNAHIAAALYISPATLERTISHIFTVLGLGESEGNRRVLAVLEYLKQ